MIWVSPGERALAILKEARCISLVILAQRLGVRESTAKKYVAKARKLLTGEQWITATRDAGYTEYLFADYSGSQREMFRRRATKKQGPRTVRKEN